MLEYLDNLATFALDMCVSLAGPIGYILVLVAFATGLIFVRKVKWLPAIVVVCTLVVATIFGFLFTATSAGVDDQPELHIAGWDYAPPALMTIENERLFALPRAERNWKLLDDAGNDVTLVWTAESLELGRGLALLTAVLTAMVVGLLFGRLFEKRG